jgi:hypothetical protein
MARACNMYETREMHIKLWSESLKERDPLRRPKRRWEDNIRCILGRVWETIDWINLAQDRDQ